MSVWSAWTGPLAPAHYACTGWDTFPASLASLAPLALLDMVTFEVSLKTTQMYQSLSVDTRFIIFKVPVSHLTKCLVCHLKLVILKTLVVQGGGQTLLQVGQIWTQNSWQVIYLRWHILIWHIASKNPMLIPTLTWSQFHKQIIFLTFKMPKFIYEMNPWGTSCLFW